MTLILINIDAATISVSCWSKLQNSSSYFALAFNYSLKRTRYLVDHRNQTGNLLLELFAHPHHALSAVPSQLASAQITQLHYQLECVQMVILHHQCRLFPLKRSSITPSLPLIQRFPDPLLVHSPAENVIDRAPAGRWRLILLHANVTADGINSRGTLHLHGPLRC